MGPHRPLEVLPLEPLILLDFPPSTHPFPPVHTPHPSKTGSYVANRVSDKLTPLHDRIYCCRSGSAADTQALADYARRALSDFSLVKSGLPSVSSAAHIFRKMCYDNKDRLSAGIIVAGWDAVEGGQVYEIPLGGTCVRGNIALGGSGSTYIHGFVDSAFRVGEWEWLFNGVRGGGVDDALPRFLSVFAVLCPPPHQHHAL